MSFVLWGLAGALTHFAAFRLGVWRGFYSTPASVVIANDKWWRWACGVRKAIGRKVDMTKEDR